MSSPLQTTPSATPGVDQLLTVDEVAKLLRLGRSTVYLEIQAGRIPARKARGSSRIRSSDLQAYIESLPALQTKSEEHDQ